MTKDKQGATGFEQWTGQVQVAERPEAGWPSPPGDARRGPTAPPSLVGVPLHAWEVQADHTPIADYPYTTEDQSAERSDW